VLRERTLGEEDDALDPPARPSVLGRVVLAVGVLLHLAVGVLVLASGLIMPAWAVVVLALVWVAGAVVILRTPSGRRPAASVLVPLATVAVWFLAALAGEAWLGWTA
jgi:hypothetical protein